MAIERGPTWEEDHRHACEVRYICSLPTLEARRRYFDGWTNEQGRLIKPLASTRGEAAAQRLREDVRRAWAQRGSEAPTPRQEGQGSAAPAGGHPGEQGLRNSMVHVPADGSLPAPGREGPLRRVGCVDSGVCA